MSYRNQAAWNRNRTQQPEQFGRPAPSRHPDDNHPGSYESKGKGKQDPQPRVSNQSNDWDRRSHDTTPSYEPNGKGKGRDDHSFLIPPLQFNGSGRPDDGNYTDWDRLSHHGSSSSDRHDVIVPHFPSGKGKGKKTDPSPARHQRACDNTMTQCRKYRCYKRDFCMVNLLHLWKGEERCKYDHSPEDDVRVHGLHIPGFSQIDDSARSEYIDKFIASGKKIIADRYAARDADDSNLAIVPNHQRIPSDDDVALVRMRVLEMIRRGLDFQREFNEPFPRIIDSTFH
jgi:hypothetical protein